MYTTTSSKFSTDKPIAKMGSFCILEPRRNNLCDVQEQDSPFAFYLAVLRLFRRFSRTRIAPEGDFLRQGAPNLGAKSGVSGRTRLLPGTLAHVLVVLHNTLPTGHENDHSGWTHQGEDVGR